MRVYRVLYDSDVRGESYPKDDTIWKTDLLNFDGRRRGLTWAPPEVEIEDQLKRRANFFRFASGSITLDSTAREKLEESLQRAGELLPLFWRGERYWVLNVTKSLDALDSLRTEWKLEKKSGQKLRITAYAFRRDQLGAGLFKIPETRRSEVLFCEESDNSEHGFKAGVEQHGLTGLRFEELWQADRQDLIKCTWYGLPTGQSFEKT